MYKVHAAVINHAVAYRLNDSWHCKMIDLVVAMTESLYIKTVGLWYISPMIYRLEMSWCFGSYCQIICCRLTIIIIIFFNYYNYEPQTLLLLMAHHCTKIYLVYA